MIRPTTARFGALLVATIVASSPAAGDSQFLLNFDLVTLLPDGSEEYSIQLQGIGLSDGKAFHGQDLGKYDYFLTVTEVKDGKGKLTIEFYAYETRRKQSDVVSEIVEEVEFSLGAPANFESMTDAFGVDLAFSIVSR